MGGLATRRRAALLAATAALVAFAAQPASAAPRIEVVVRLTQPSLVEFARAQRSLQGYGQHRRVLASAFGSRLYLSRLAADQARETQRIERAVPGSRVRRHYRTVLDGVSVLLRPGQVASLGRVAGVAAVYPNLRYHALASTGVPDVIGASAAWGPELTNAGQGIKIGVIDDGIDVHHPYFAPDGLVAPAGYPRGNRHYTSGKVIVARAFAPAGAPLVDHLPFDPAVSRHGTHVSGILAGDDGVSAPGELGRPTVNGLSGVAPRAWLGNYRGLSQPDPEYGAVGSTADLVAAVEAAVNDGMDVINLSIGGTEIAPSSDALVGAVEGAVASGVVVVAAAGNDRGDLGYGSIDSPGAAADAITVAATSSSTFYARASAISGSGPVPAQLRNFGVAAPGYYDPSHRITGILKRGPAANRRLCHPLPFKSMTNRIALATRGGCSVIRKAAMASGAGALAVLVPSDGSGPPESIYDETDLPVLVAQAPVVAATSAYVASGVRARLTLFSITHAEPAIAGVVASFSSAGPTPYDHLLKPDISAPGVAILSSVPGPVAGGPADWAIFDGTSMASPAVAGAAALVLQAHPTWTPADVKAALMGTATTAYVDEAGTREASPLSAGAGLANVVGAITPGVLADPASVDFGDVEPGAATALPVTVRDVGDGSGAWIASVRVVGPTPAGVALSVTPSVVVPAGGSAQISVTATIAAGAKDHDAAGVVELVQGDRTRRIPFWLRVDRPALARKAARTLRVGQTRAGDTTGAGNVASVYRYPTDATSSGLPKRYDGPEQLYRFRLGPGNVNAGVTVTTASGVVAYPILLRRRDENSVAGQSGLPLNVGPLPSEFSIVPAAGLDFPPAGDWYVSVESPPHASGRYRIRLWANDHTPPRVRVLGQIARGGRRLLRLQITDAGSGVNPGGILVTGEGISHRSLRFDARTGIGTVDLSRLLPGTHRIRIRAPDLAETKDVLSADARPSNTTTRVIRVTIPAA